MDGPLGLGRDRLLGEMHNLQGHWGPELGFKSKFCHFLAVNLRQALLGLSFPICNPQGVKQVNE